MKIEQKSEPSKYANNTYRVETPDGTMFVSLMEDDSGKPVAVQLNIGKAGIAITAWANALARILTIALEHGATIDDLIVELSGQTSDKERRGANGVKIRSGPEGISYALLQYKHESYDAWCRKMNINRDTLDELPRLDD